MEKEKKHVFGKILLAVLAVAVALCVLTPVAAWCYLRFSGFEEERIAPPEETGEVILEKDGSLTVTLTPYEVRETFTGEYLPLFEEAMANVGSVTVDGIDLYPRDGGAVLYVDATALKFVSMHLRLNADVTAVGENMTVTLTEVRLGKLISLPLEKLTALGVPETVEAFTPQLYGETPRSVTFGEKVTTVSLGDSGLGEAAACLAGDLKNRARLYACLGYVPEELPAGARALFSDEEDSETMAAQLRALMRIERDPAELYLRLLGFASEETAARSREKLSECARDRLLAGTEQKAAEYRAAADAGLLACVEPYRALLDRTEQAWCDLAFTVEKDAVIYTETGGRFPPDISFPAAQLTDEYCGVYMMMYFGTTWPVRWAELPRLEELNIASSASRAAKNLPFYGMGMAVIVSLPDGTPLLLYYQQNGNLVFVPVTLESFPIFLGDDIPLILDDDVPRPPIRPAPYVLPDGTVVELLTQP